MTDSIIEARDLCKSYLKENAIIRAVDTATLTVERGESVALTGPSGSGKSTLMHLLGCLDMPDQGEYRLDGQRIRDLNPARLSALRNEKIGFIFQSYFLLPHASAKENVGLPLLLRGVPRRKRELMAAEMLDHVGMSDRLHHLPHELSGGQRQRVAVARALVSRPLVVFADEPTGNLDEVSTKAILDLFDNIHVSGTTIVLVTHSPAVAARCTTRYRVDAGRLEQIE